MTDVAGIFGVAGIFIVFVTSGGCVEDVWRRRQAPSRFMMYSLYYPMYYLLYFLLYYQHIQGARAVNTLNAV